MRKIPWFFVGFLICIGLTGRLAAALSQDKEGGGVHGASIENHHWRIAKYHVDGKADADKDGLVAAKEFADITFRGGRVEGGPGCGGWIGAYAISGDTLTVQAGIALGGLCSRAMAAQGEMVERDFKRELRILPKGSDVLLTDKDGIAEILLVPFKTK